MDRFRFETEQNEWKETKKYLKKMEKFEKKSKPKLKNPPHAKESPSATSTMSGPCPAMSSEVLSCTPDFVPAVASFRFPSPCPDPMDEAEDTLAPIPWNPIPSASLWEYEDDRLLDVSVLVQKLDKDSQDFLIKHFRH